MVSHFGVLSSHSKHRGLVVPDDTDPERFAHQPALGDQLELTLDGGNDEVSASRRSLWGWLLRHVFRADFEVCNLCGGPMRWVLAARDPPAIAGLLSNHSRIWRVAGVGHSWATHTVGVRGLRRPDLTLVGWVDGAHPVSARVGQATNRKGGRAHGFGGVRIARVVLESVTASRFGRSLSRAAVGALLLVASCRGPAQPTQPSAQLKHESAPELGTPGRELVQAVSPQTVEEELADDAEPRWPELLAASPAVVAAEQPSCRAAARNRQCTTNEPLAALASALTQVEPKARDRALSNIATCDGLPPGLVNVLRAQLWPACGERLAERALSEQTPPAVHALLVAASYAARQHRFRLALLARDPPLITASEAESYLTRRLEPWLQPRVKWLREQQRLLDGFADHSAAQALALWSLSESWVSLGTSTWVRPRRLGQAVRTSYDLRQGFYSNVEPTRQQLKTEATPLVLRAFDAVSARGSLRAGGSGAALESSIRYIWPKKLVASPPLALVLRPRLDLPRSESPLQTLLARLPPHYVAWLWAAGTLSFDSLDAQSTELLLEQGLSPGTRRLLARRLRLAQASGDAQTESWLRWARVRFRVRLGLLSHDRRQFEWALSDLARLRSLHAHHKQQRQQVLWDEATWGELRLAEALCAALVAGPKDLLEWSERWASQAPIEPREAPIDPLDTAQLHRLAEDRSISTFLRGLSSASAASLDGASARGIPSLKAVYRLLETAADDVKSDVYWACIDSQRVGLRDTWGMPELPRCEQMKFELAQHPDQESKLIGKYGRCPLWHWNYQRELDARTTCEP